MPRRKVLRKVERLAVEGCALTLGAVAFLGAKSGAKSNAWPWSVTPLHLVAWHASAQSPAQSRAPGSGRLRPYTWCRGIHRHNVWRKVERLAVEGCALTLCGMPCLGATSGAKSNA